MSTNKHDKEGQPDVPPSNHDENQEEYLDLRGAWQGKFPDGFDLEAYLKEVRSEWEKEWDENGNFVDG